MVIELLYTSGSWECPARVFSVQVECWGAGGASTMNGGGYPRGGAGGGAYAKKTVPATSGTHYMYVIGGGDFGENKDTFWINASTVMAKGGGSTDTPFGAPGGAASESVGDVKYSGGHGDDYDYESFTPGGGGGGAGSMGIGQDALGAIGGSGCYEYGGDGGSGARLVQGEPGNNYGGGAAGCLTDEDVLGGSGLIRITYDVIPINDLLFQATSRCMFNGSFRKMR